MTAVENKENNEAYVAMTTNECKDYSATDVQMNEASKEKQGEENETNSSLEHQYKGINCFYFAIHLNLPVSQLGELVHSKAGMAIFQLMAFALRG